MNLSTRIQIQKPSYSVALFKISRIGKTLETQQSRLTVSRSEGEGSWVWLQTGTDGGRGDSGNVLEFDSGYDCTTL